MTLVIFIVNCCFVTHANRLKANKETSAEDRVPQAYIARRLYLKPAIRMLDMDRSVTGVACSLMANVMIDFRYGG